MAKRKHRAIFSGSIGCPELELVSPGADLQHTLDLCQMVANNLGPQYNYCTIFDTETGQAVEHLRIIKPTIVEKRP